MISPQAVLIPAIITGVIAAIIGHRKGHPVWGFFLGFVLSVIGIVIVACVKPDREVLVRREAARLSVQEEARRRVAAERVPAPRLDRPVSRLRRGFEVSGHPVEQAGRSLQIGGSGRGRIGRQAGQKVKAGRP